MKKVRYGVVGVGNQGSGYAGHFLRGSIENGELTAICDLKPSRMEQLLDIFKDKPEAKNVRCFTDYKEMLSSGLCDAVLVVTPHYAHPEITSAFLERGVHVLCDKPAGVYTKQVREMNEMAEKSSARFAMMFNQRTKAVYRKMREIIQEGGIGELQRVNWIITDWYRTRAYYQNGDWRATWKGEGGGVLINQCPHQIDLVQWILGEMPVSVHGFCQYGRWHDIEVEDEVTAFFEYKNGATGVFITTTGEAPGTNRFEVSGTKGKLLCENQKLYWYKNEVDSLEFSQTCQSGFDQPPLQVVEVETDGKDSQHIGIINNFTNAILGLEEQFVQGVEGINGVELMNAIELSGWKGGEKVMLPVNEDEYLAELEKRQKTSRAKTGVVETVVDNSMSFGS